MILLHDKIKLTLGQLIFDGLDKMFDERVLTLENIYNMLAPPPQQQMGHFAFPCFQLAKTFKQAPPKIASQLQDNIAKHELVESTQVAGPYLNFTLSNAQLGKLVVEPIIDGQYFSYPLTSDSPRSMIEYSQPNTHKILHVGHMRNLAMGNSLILLHRYCDYPILSATFPGDVGTHVAKCLWYMKYRNKEACPAERKGAWLGKMYTLGTLALEQEDSEENRQQLTNILEQIEQKSGEFYQLWKETRQWSIDLMQEIYDWVGVQFDHWYFESDVDSDSLKLAKDLYKQGLLVESQGAIGMDMTDDKLGFCMLIKSDGTGLYATKDVELARRKFQDHHIEKNLYIVDTRQSHHFKQVFKVLEKMGMPQAQNCFHLAYDFVELPDGAMSSRKGNIIPLQELIDKMIHLIKNEHLSRYQGIWTETEIEETANKVAIGAINYGMLKIDPNRKIVFDLKEWLKLDGDSGPYLQYVYARIQSMLLKVRKSSVPLEKIQWSLLTHPSETALLVKLSQFNTVILSSCEQYKTSHLCNFLYFTGKLYNSFYAECPVAKADNIPLRDARLALSQAVATTIKKGLELLGIPTPDRM